jgi:hypothetical protein
MARSPMRAHRRTRCRPGALDLLDEIDLVDLEHLVEEFQVRHRRLPTPTVPISSDSIRRIQQIAASLAKVAAAIQPAAAAADDDGARRVVQSGKCEGALMRVDQHSAGSARTQRCQPAENCSCIFGMSAIHGSQKQSPRSGL